MGEIRFVGTGETCGYPYQVCKKKIVGPGKTRGYPCPVCKKNAVKNLSTGKDKSEETSAGTDKTAPHS